MYESLIKKLLFRFDPETAHHLVFSLLGATLPIVGGAAQGMFRVDHPALVTEAFGLRFPNPVGLAAGLDKNALLIEHWPKFGFGFVEIGAVTPKPQAGNDKPRLFRLPADEALINRMGFNNDGVDAIARRLEKRPKNLIVGANIGKNKATPNEEAERDYVICYNRLRDRVDFFVVNVSSPNTVGLRALQEKEGLERILSAVQNANHAAGRPLPILLKIAPDLTESQIDEAIEVARQTGMAGMVAANTTISRSGLKTPAAVVEKIGAGGLSGAPVRSRSTQIVRQIAAAGMPVIGVGGIDSPQAAIEKLEAGACLLQLYTGFIYKGPALTTEILKKLTVFSKKTE